MPDRGGFFGFGILPINLDEQDPDVAQALSKHEPSVRLQADGAPVTQHATHILMTKQVKIATWRRLPEDMSLLNTPDDVHAITTGTRFEPFPLEEGEPTWWWGRGTGQVTWVTFDTMKEADRFEKRFNAIAEQKVRDELEERRP